METSNKLIGEQLSLWTSSAADIPANHLVQQENEKEQTTQDTFGHGYEKPLASYNPDTQSWRTSEDISLWGDYKLLENLPKSGMTRNGVLYQQPVWVRPIDATESLSWPTPRNCSAMAATITPESAWNPKRFPNLETVVGRRMWPTPTAVTRPMEGNVRMYRAKIQAGEMTEAEAEAILGKSVWEAHSKIPAMWPTPTVDDSKNVTRMSGDFQSLTRKVMENPWPTPTTVDTFTPKSRSNPTLGDAARKSEDSNGKLNPTWVEWLMGFPIGWTDLED
jgi:hypothetical protein